MEIIKQTRRLNLRKFSFSHRVVDDWNSLPKKVVETRDVEQFKVELGAKDIRVLHTALAKPEIHRASELNATRRAPYVERISTVRWIQVNTSAFQPNSGIIKNNIRLILDLLKTLISVGKNVTYI